MRALGLVLGAACIQVAAAAHTPGEIGSLAALLATPQARAELALSRSQVAAIEAIKAEYLDGMRTLGGGLDASCMERAEALRNETNARAQAVLNTTQRRRLPALEHRALGATLLYAPSARDTFRLTGGQRRAIDQIRAEAHRTETRINLQYERGRITRDRRLAMLREDRLHRAGDIWNLLTPAQRRAFAAYA